MPILTPGSINGRPIYNFPATPNFAEVSFSINDNVAVNMSPFTGTMQVLSWQGSDNWSASVTLPPMLPSVAQTWSGWAGVVRGRLSTFLLGDPLHVTPTGTPSGSPTVNSGTLVGATIINTSGWTANVNNLLVVGDYLQIGYRLHIVCGNDTGGNVNSSSSGTAQVEIWPSIRDAITTATTIGTSNCKGLFMLASNLRTWSSTADQQLIAMSFKAVEAR